MKQDQCGSLHIDFLDVIFIHSRAQPMFIENLLCTRRSSKSGDGPLSP